MLYEKIHYFIPRILLGSSWGDIFLALDDMKNFSWKTWMLGFKQQAEKYEKAATQALIQEDSITAHDFFLRASACYHWSEFMYFQDPLEKAALRQKVSYCFGRALPYIPVDYKKITWPFRQYTLSGYLMASQLSSKKPCVILINGLDSAKEVELFYFAQHFIKRNLSIFIFDGPGQGELLGKTPMITDFEKIMATIIDELSGLDCVDSHRIGLFGVSYGGYLALRSASCLGRKIKACINLSGGFDLDHFSTLSRRIRQDFSYVFQKPALEMQTLAKKELHLKNLPPPTAPVFTIHGDKDPIFPIENCHRVIEWTRAYGKTLIYPDENHVCQNYFQEYAPIMSDWMQKTLS